MRSIIKLFALILFFFTSIIGINPVNAHTQLLHSDPKDGVVIQEWPGQVLLTFNDNLQTIKNQKVNYVVVNNALGDQVSADDEIVIQNQVRVSLLPNTVQGPVLVTYRVVGKDGHPIEGEFAFGFGEENPPQDGTMSDENGANNSGNSGDDGSTENRNIGIFVFSVAALFILSGLYISVRRAKQIDN